VRAGPATPPTAGVAFVPGANDNLVGSATLPASDSADLSTGSHSGVGLALTSPLTPDPTKPYFVVVANPSGANHFTESDETNGSDPNDTQYLAISSISITSLAWNTDRDGTLPNESHRGLDFSYTIQNADLPMDSVIAFYWASGTDRADIIAPATDRVTGVPATVPLIKTLGVHDHNNDPAQWSTPPVGTDYVLAVIDPDDKVVKEPESAANGINLVAHVELATEQQILDGSVIQPTTDGPNITAAFVPGHGSGLIIPLSEAEVALGVDHFNWIQNVIYTPPTMQPITVLNAQEEIDSSKYPYSIAVTPSGLEYLVANPSGGFALDPNKSIDYSSHPAPFLDPLVPFAGPDTYRRGYIVQGKYAYLVDLSPPADDYYYYYNEPVTGSQNDLVGEMTSYTLAFEDGAVAPVAPDPLDPAITIDPYAMNGSRQFETVLVGVVDDGGPGDYITWLGKGYNTSFLWQTNATELGGGATFDNWDKSPVVNPIPPGVSGGVFDVRLTDNNLLTAQNSPPVLTPIGDKRATQGSKLTFAAKATDPDPGQMLTYSLDPGSPAGAKVDPITGVFTWTPTASGDYKVTIRSTDNGSPPLGDSKTFTISVKGSVLTVNLASNSGITQGASFAQSGSFSSLTPGAFKATVDFGDGSGLQSLVPDSADTFALSHTYVFPGTFTITVAVTDPFGQVGTQTEQVVVTPYVSGYGPGPDAFVTTLYNQVLGRAPEPAGLLFWSKQLASKVKPRTIATAFWASRERHILQREHKAPPIAFGRALKSAAHAWKQATKVGAVHPTGKATAKP
jgi:Putative Ig domain/Domain of unknown function (DUF4214)/PKD domain